MDYLKFEVLTTSVVTFRMQNYGGNLHLLGSFIGRDDAFGFVDSPFYLWVFAGHDFNGPSPSFTRTLEAGTYVVATGQDSHSGYDIFDGFRAVNPEGGGGGFIFGNYAYDILGDVRALEFWDGDLDGTFTITRFPVPEPGFGYLLLVTTLTTVGRRRRVRP